MRLGHIPSLDGLRGIAIILVLAGHFGVPGFPLGGSAGVSLFFGLSGFLITALLLDEISDRGRVELRAFYLRRARRLLPALVLVVGFVLLTGGLDAYLAPAAFVAVYATNWAWIGGVELGGLAHAWSLAVEEQFYVVWPLLLPLLVARGWALRGTVVLVGLSFLAIAVLWLGDAPYLRVFAGSDTRAHSILLGAVVAIIRHRSGDLKLPVTAAGIGAILLYVVASGVVLDLNTAIVGVPCAVLVAWAAARPKVLTWAWLRWTGRISYGLYLWHYPIQHDPIHAFVDWPDPVRILALAAASYAAAAASYYLVERHFLRRRRPDTDPVPDPIR